MKAMTNTQDAYSVLQQTLIQECKNVRSMRAEMNELFASYYKYLQLSDQMRTSRRRISYVVGVLGPAGVEETTKVDDTASLREALEAQPSPQELREKLRLWRAVREYLRAVPGKSKIGDIQKFLTSAGLENVTRQAIEAALKRHNDSFEITTKSHERYVALKR